MRSRLTVVVGLVVWSGCSNLLAPANYSGIVLGNLKFPLHVPTRAWSPVNDALNVAVNRCLDEYADDRAAAQQCVAQVPQRTGRWARADSVDALEEFHDQSDGTLVIVAISGGGARAARLAAHALALLERQHHELIPEAGPMINRIDAFSTVSGGSIYAYQVARRLYEIGKVPAASAGQSPPPDPRIAFFQETVKEKRTTWGTEDLGTFAAASAVGLYGTGLLQTLFTDQNYLDDLAKGMEASRLGSGSWWELPLPTFISPKLKFGDLPPRPRFLFNTTALETGGPVVLTQRITNLPSAAPPPVRSARVDLLPQLPSCGEEKCPLPPQPHTERAELGFCNPARPLLRSHTLEEIGSSPANFPVAYAAAASAAFPFGVQPLPLRKYQLSPNTDTFIGTSTVLSLVDGGVYDNSGMTAAADLFEHMSQYHNVQHLVLIAINADATLYDADLPHHAADTSYPTIGDFVGWPVPSLFEAADSLNLIHFANKRRGEDIAWARLSEIEFRLRSDAIARAASARGAGHGAMEADGTRAHLPRKVYEQIAPELAPGATSAQVKQFADQKAREYVREEGTPRQYVQYFPINLAQLALSDPYGSKDVSYYDLVKDVPTAYWLNRGNDAALEAAAEKIVSTPQPRGWKVGPNCCRQRDDRGEPAEVTRLDQAVAFALQRASADDWDRPIDDPQWCAHPEWRSTDDACRSGG